MNYVLLLLDNEGSLDLMMHHLHQIISRVEIEEGKRKMK